MENYEIVPGYRRGSSLYTLDECRICLTPNETPVCLVPCGHNRMCHTCAERIAQETNRCPICRTTLTLTVRMY